MSATANCRTANYAQFLSIHLSFELQLAFDEEVSNFHFSMCIFSKRPNRTDLTTKNFSFGDEKIKKNAPFSKLRNLIFASFFGPFFGFKLKISRLFA